MPYLCKGRCKDEPGARPASGGRRPTSERVCKTCRVQIETEQNRCPCCSCPLRIHTRTKAGRARRLAEVARY